MLAILDPSLFEPQTPVGVDALRSIVRLFREIRPIIPNVDWYWARLVKEFIAPLSRTITDHDYLTHLDILRNWLDDPRLPDAPRKITVWDFRTMFQGLGTPWVDIMRRIATGCVLTGRHTYLITRLRSGVNAKLHKHGHVVCIEKLCWNLRVQPHGHPLTRIPCICSPRNYHVPWTCRHDDRLPAGEDAAEFPFSPLPDWEKSSTEVFSVHQSRPVWIDARGNAWAKPSTGRGHHWDLYLTQALEEDYGLGQLNIVAWGVPSEEGQSGALHHVPTGKSSRLKKRTGWRD